MKKTMRTIVFSIVLAAMTLSANNLNAQDRGLFGRGETETEAGNRAGESFLLGTQQFGPTETNDGFGIGTQPFGQEAPLTSGIGILLAAGAGYAALRRKKSTNTKRNKKF